MHHVNNTVPITAAFHTPQVTLSIVPWKSAARGSSHSGDFAVMAEMEASLVIQEQMKSTLYNMTVPVTTRPMADGEEQGREYFFVDVQDFEEVGPRSDKHGDTPGTISCSYACVLITCAPYPSAYRCWKARRMG